MLLFRKSEINHYGMMELRIELKQPRVYLDACIEVITKERGTKKYYITLRPNALRTRIIRVPKNTLEIRILAPLYKGNMEFNQKQLIKFSWPAIFWIINGRLKHHKRKFCLPVFKLWKTYNQTFDIRMGIKNYSFWVKHSEQKQKKLSLKKRSNLKELNIVLFSTTNKTQPIQDITRYKKQHNILIHNISSNSQENIQRLQKSIERKPNSYFLMIFQTDHLSIDPLMLELDKIEDSDLIYADDDHITNRKRHSPNFKPSWNPELWKEYNFIGRAAILKGKLLSDIQWSEFLPTSDAIRSLVNKHENLKIHHIPSICLHQYMEKLPLPQNKTWHNQLSNKNKLVSGEIAVDIIIPTKDKAAILKKCIESIIEKTLYTNFNIIILDNNSCENETKIYLKNIEQSKKVKVFNYPKPFNYSAINNFGANQSKADVLVLLNNDIEVISPNWLNEMVSLVSKSDIGCVGAKLYYPNGWIQHAGVILGLGDVAGHSHRFYPGESLGYMERLAHRQQVSAVTAACLAVRRSVWDEVEGLDEKNLSVAYNDVDFCLRVQEKGYRNLWTPYAELIHHESLSRGADDTPKKKKRYQSEVAYMRKRWSKELEHDPFYHRAFSRTKEDFSLQF